MASILCSAPEPDCARANGEAVWFNACSSGGLPDLTRVGRGWGRNTSRSNAAWRESIDGFSLAADATRNGRLSAPSRSDGRLAEAPSLVAVGRLPYDVVSHRAGASLQ